MKRTVLVCDRCGNDAPVLLLVNTLDSLGNDWQREFCQACFAEATNPPLGPQS